jgi:hypothetical protein
MYYQNDEERAKREEWLRSLKVGDVVGIETHNQGDRNWTRHTVSKITKTGRIKLEDGKDYGQDGERHENSGSWSCHTYTLVAWTSDIEAVIARRKLEATVAYYVDFSHFAREKLAIATDEELVALRDMLRKFRIEGK